jgi:hypothetical protein
MSRVAIALILGLLSAGVAQADVRTDEKTQVKFEGMLGRMLNLFGGRGARDGIVSTVSVKGDRKMTVTGDTAQIIDLKEEKVYDVNLKNKSYTVTTFADMRRQMEEARKKAEAQARESEPSQPASRDSREPQKEVEIDFSLKESGQKRAINGFDAREVVMTLAVREKGKKLEESGGLVMTSNSWLAPKIASMNDVAAFDRRYAEKMGAPTMLDAQQMAMVMAMYPQMKDAMAKFEAENVNMDGTPVLTVVKFEAVANPEQAKQQQQSRNEQQSSGGGGLLGGLGGRLGRRIAGGGDNNKPAEGAASNRATIMTMQHELLKVTPAVTDADVAIPAGFKQR